MKVFGAGLPKTGTKSLAASLIRLGYRHLHGREKEHVPIYESHNREVRLHFTGLPGRRLEVCWETDRDGSNWAAFLVGGARRSVSP